jgi:hypothetical protein
MKFILVAIPLVLWSAAAEAATLTGPTLPSVSSASYLIGSFTGAEDVCSADIDSDGDLDVAAAKSSQVYLWENLDGSGTSWSGRVVGTGSGTVLPIDLDQDNDIDLVSGGKWFENTDGLGESWASHTISTSGSSISLADMDNDSDSDLVVAYSYCSWIRWFENLDGIGSQWSMHQVAVPSYQIGAQASAGDLDGDGDVDIALYERDDPIFLVFCWLENIDGAGGSWETHILNDYDSYCWDMHTADLDQDSDLDILAACDLHGIHFCENLDGLGGSWAYVELDTSGYSQAFEVEFADFDLDGDFDVAGAQRNGASDVSWWENLDGSGAQWLEHPLGSGYTNSNGLDAADINEDGVPDLVISSTSAIYWIDLYSTGIGDVDAPAGFWLLPVTPNPSSGSASVSFEVPETGPVSLYVFDLSGRLVQDAGPSGYEPGCHTIQLGELYPGVYLVQMRAGEFTATQRFVVVD